MTAINPETFVRGGQTTQHWVRMAAQVIRTMITFGVLVFGVIYAVLCVRFYDVAHVHETFGYMIAEYRVEIGGTPEKDVRYKDAEAGWISRPAEDIYLDQDLKQLTQLYQDKASELAWIAVWPGAVAALLAGLFFAFAGKGMKTDNHIRGTMLVTQKELKAWSKRKWRAYIKSFGKGFKNAPRYTIAGIEFPPNAAEAQSSICGTVGTGKTNAIRELLDTVRKLDGRAIIYDRMGSYVRDFYDPERDIIINPFDYRSKAWSPFNEAENATFFTQLAEVFIPDRPNASEPFWTQSARIVFDYAARQIFESGNFSNARLREAILNIPSKELAELLSSTPGQHFFNKDIAKTSESIRANLIAELRFLENLRDDGEPFSMRDWVKSETSGGIIFLTGNAEQAAATRNIISACFEVAANALMTCPETNDPRIWFIMDEVPTLNRMPFLPKSLAEIRQFGGAFVVGYQVFSQLEDIYGDKGAQTIVGNLNNRIVFNTPDADTAEFLSKSLGSEDVEERRENITVGAHETRDGVGFMAHRTERRVVTPSQIQSLPQFEGYVRFAYDAPTAFVRFKPYEVEGTSRPGFVPYQGNGFATGQMTAARRRGASGSALGDDDTRVAFESYRARLVAAGLELYGAGEGNDSLLWTHFLADRAKGNRASDIGPPGRSIPMLGGAVKVRDVVVQSDPAKVTLEHSPPVERAAPEPEKPEEPVQLSLPMPVARVKKSAGPGNVTSVPGDDTPFGKISDTARDLGL